MVSILFYFLHNHSLLFSQVDFPLFLLVFIYLPRLSPDFLFSVFVLGLSKISFFFLATNRELIWGTWRHWSMASVFCLPHCLLSFLFLRSTKLSYHNFHNFSFCIFYQKLCFLTSVKCIGSCYPKLDTYQFCKSSLN
jgi:hypothetical protein